MDIRQFADRMDEYMRENGQITFRQNGDSVPITVPEDAHAAVSEEFRTVPESSSPTFSAAEAELVQATQAEEGVLRVPMRTADPGGLFFEVICRDGVYPYDSVSGLPVVYWIEQKEGGIIRQVSDFEKYGPTMGP